MHKDKWLKEDPPKFSLKSAAARKPSSVCVMYTKREFKLERLVELDQVPYELFSVADSDPSESKIGSSLDKSIDGRSSMREKAVQSWK